VEGAERARNFLRLARGADFDYPEPPVHFEEIPKDRRCPECARPFGFTDLQAFHILMFPAGRRTAEGRSDLEAQQAGLRSWLTRLDGFFAEASDNQPLE